MARKLSRLQRVKRKREARQGYLYIFVAIIAVIALIFWGVPALANWASLFFENDDPGIVDEFELAPTPPVIFDIPESTPSARIDVEGIAQPGVEVALYLNNVEYEKKVTDDTGSFTFDRVSLDQGENFIYAISIAKSGKESEKSKSYSINVDNTPPSVEISSPENGTEFYGDTERLVEIQGTVSDDAYNLFIGGRKAIINSDKSFNLRYQLQEGAQEIEIVVSDKAGNESKSSLSLSWRP